jgi:hypothetical protein
MGEFVHQISEITHTMAPITLEEIEALALMDRVDVKFILHEREFLPALMQVADQYHILEIDRLRGANYLSTYFDTPDFAMYHMHHNGARSRFKVRWRWYLDSSIIYLEVKEKTNRERTRKQRVRLTGPIDDLRGLDLSWLPAHFPHDPATLAPTVWTRFRRLMLADIDRGERITIDLDLQVGDTTRTVALPGLVIVEIKQRKFSLSSPLARQFHDIHRSPRHVSKYCVGMVTLHPEIKNNQFKQVIRRLETICAVTLL